MRASFTDAAVVRTLPDFKARRTTPPRLLGSAFAQELAMRSGAASPRPPAPAARPNRAAGRAGTPLDPAELAGGFGGHISPARAELLDRAKGLLDIPYVWGSDTPKGLDCSSFLSRIWGVPRQTTDTLSTVADPITKDELQAGDAMNLPTWKDPDGYGHVRMFDRWADANKTKVWVYEETQGNIGKSVHRVIDYDPRYQPMRLKDLPA